MLDKNCVVFLYEQGKYDTSILAVVDKMSQTYKDTYAVEIASDVIIPYKRTRLERKFYMFNLRNFGFLNRTKEYLTGLNYKYKAVKTKKEYKPYKNSEEDKKKFMYKLKTKYRRVHNILIRYNPEIVVCSSPRLLYKACKAKANLGLKHTKVIGFITDYVLNKNFVHFKADGYMVQNDNVKQALIDAGISEEIINVIGTPVNDEHLIKFDKEEVKKEFGIDNELINIVFVGGRYGSESVKDAFAACSERLSNCNLVVLTGGSTSLMKYCDVIAKSKKSETNVYMVESIDNMAKAYALADIIISTPTATVTYEAMLHDLRLLVLKGSDRIERGNSHYLMTDMLALRGDTPSDALASVFKLIEDEEVSELFRENRRAFLVPDAAKRCANILHKSVMELETQKDEEKIAIDYAQKDTKKTDEVKE